MKVFSKVVNILSSFLDRVAGWVFAGLMVLVVINVILRAFFNSPIKGTFEYVSYYTGLAIALSIAFCALQDGHVSVTFLTEKFFSSKIVKAIDVLMNSISIVFFVFGFWKLVEYANGIAARGEVSLTTRTPFYPFVYATAIGFLFLAMVLVNRVIGLLKKEEGKN
ncbi:MAG TPA: TRAP transporter small permease [Tissierellia bacterium]|nr:TRAP transporter small permease [Tissierellia bacterium]